MAKLVEAGEQLAVLNEKLASQRVAVVDKTAACDALLNEITAATLRTEDKKTLAMDKGKEAEDQSKDIEMEKVRTPILVDANRFLPRDAPQASAVNAAPIPYVTLVY